MKIELTNEELQELIDSRVNIQRKMEQSLQKEKALQTVMQKVLLKIESHEKPDVILSEIKAMIDGVRIISF